MPFMHVRGLIVIDRGTEGNFHYGTRHDNELGRSLCALKTNLYDKQKLITINPAHVECRPIMSYELFLHSVNVFKR